MLRISKLTDYGTVVLACLAAAPDLRQTATAGRRAHPARPADRQQAAEDPCIALASLTSARGAHGGYQLARPATRISAAAIIDAIEGPVAITECSGNHSACDFESICRTGRCLAAHQWLRSGASLDEITLAQLSGQEAVAVWRPDAGHGAAPTCHVPRPRPDEA